MTALALSPFSFLTSIYKGSAPTVEGVTPFDEAERRKIVGDLISAGACDSELGVQMLMSVFPDQL